MADAPHTNTDSKGALALKPSPLPNFRRSSRAFPNASDTSREDPVIRRFFVILPPDFKEQLELPPQFCRELGRDVPNDAIVISSKGMWAIAFCHRDFVFSGNGWRSFIEHHHLKKEDLVWFEVTDSMVFKVHVFDLYANEEKLLSGNGEAERSKIQLDLLVTGCNYGGLHRHGFTVNIEKHHLNRSHLTIPADFVKRNDRLREKKRVILVNTGRHAWEVELVHVHDPRFSEQSQRHFKMRHGWPAFFKSNNLKIGDVCFFSPDDCSTLTSPHSIVMAFCIVRYI